MDYSVDVDDIERKEHSQHFYQDQHVEQQQDMAQEWSQYEDQTGFQKPIDTSYNGNTNQEQIQYPDPTYNEYKNQEGLHHEDNHHYQYHDQEVGQYQDQYAGQLQYKSKTQTDKDQGYTNFGFEYQAFDEYNDIEENKN